ncbi:MAG TPA: AAA family ATPase [Planktothrix sp.]|jgi:hypothetical protein
MFLDSLLEAMRARFVGFDEFTRAMAISLVTKRNLIAFGPGGHAKSEGADHCLYLVSPNPADCLVQSCGEGMTEERLYGGVDLKALEEEHVLQFNTDQSFLKARWVVFEEMLDMPDVAALSLRDTLTARQLRNGRQTVSMDTEAIFALTNREPKEKAGLDPSYRALLERFPLQLRISWGSYQPNDYVRLFDKVFARSNQKQLERGALLAELEEVRRIYAETSVDSARETLAMLLSKPGEKGQPISPRTAIYASEIVRATAALRGSTVVEPEDLADLIYLPDIAMIDEIWQELRRARAVVETERQVRLLDDELTKLLDDLQNSDTPEATARAISGLEALESKLATLDMHGVIAKRRYDRLKGKLEKS